MDLKTEFEVLKKELMELGFDQEKLDQLLLLATEEILDIAVSELIEKDDEQQLEEITNLMEQETKTEEEAAEKINKIFSTVYGSEAENKKLSLLNQYLKETIEMTKKAKDLANRYEQGDPTAVAAIQSTMSDPDVKKVEEMV